MKIQSRYEYDPKQDLLGKGGFARVYKARDTLLDRDVAIKIFSNSGTGQYTVLNEIKKVIQFVHPNLLRYYDVILLEQENALGEKEQLQIGVMELANAGDLKDFAKANPNSPLLFKLLKEVLEALTYLHNKNIIHRDLKAQNVLLIEANGELTAKISDFGISKDTSSGNHSSSMMVGTIEYMAPEQFNPQKFGIDGKIASNVDLWSFGVMVHELLMDSTPFGSRDGNTTAEQIMSTILSTEQPKDIDKLPEPYKTVVKKCLVANAKERVRKASELLKFFDGQAHTTPPTSKVSQTDDATKVYAKSSQMADDATKVYTKSSQMVDDATKVYPKNSNHQSNNDVQQIKQGELSTGTKKKLMVVVGVIGILVFSLISVIQHQFKVNDVNDVNYQYQRGVIFYNAGDYSQAMEWFLKADAQNNAAAQYVVGYMYDEGQGFERDSYKAMEWYKKAAAQNNADAQYAVGYSYDKGTVVQEDKSQAMEWYKKAAAQNNADAQYAIGFLYQHPEGVQEDYKQAMEWYKKAAAQNNVNAQYYIGELYEAGLGVQRDVKQAKEWYKKAADQGYERAKNELRKLGG